MDVSIELLNCGSLGAGRSSFEQGASDDKITVPVPSWLIRHPKGLVLVDAGMSTGLTAPGKLLDFWRNFFDIDLTDGDMVTQQLASRQVDVADIDVVILTHLHFDHSGGLAQIPNARVIVQQDEWASGIDDDKAAANGFSRADYDLGHDLEMASGEHDVFGDGLVTCIPTPGHTPGHQSVRVRLANSEVVLCGDCAYFEETLTGGALPPIGHDHELQMESIGRLLKMREAGALVIPGHDAATLSKLPAVLS